MEVTSECVEGLGTPVWKIKGLVSQSLRQDLYRVMKEEKLMNFSKAKTGMKMSIEHKSTKGMSLFSKNACVMLSKSILSREFLQLLSDLLRQSDSSYKRLMHDSKTLLRPLRLSHLVNGDTRLGGIDTPWLIDMKRLYGVSRPETIAQWYGNAFNCVPFIPRMQFSIMPPGSYIPPHTDISNKIATLMVYLPDSQRQSQSSLGTTFWKPSDKNGHVLMQKESNFIIDDELRRFKMYYEPIKTEFQDHSCVLFFRSNNSWHSFEYKENASLGDRYSININLLYPVGFEI